MPPSKQSQKARQLIYSAKWRKKQTKIKALEKQIDKLIIFMEKMPYCPACQTESVRVHGSILCTHTHARKRANNQLELIRGDLRGLDH